MKFRHFLLLALALVLLGGQLPGAVIGPGQPSGGITVGDVFIPFTLEATENPKVTRLVIDTATADWSLTGSATVNPDPFIDYGFSFKNLTGSPLAFSIFVLTPYIAGPYDTATSSHSGSVTDAPGIDPADGAVTITAAAGGVHQPSYDGTPFGAIMGGCDTTGSIGFSSPCASETLTGIAIATAAAGMLRVDLGASVSAGDRYTFNGAATIDRAGVPEPGTWLLTTAALGLLVMRRRFQA